MLLVRKFYSLLVREAPSDPVGAIRKLFSEPLSTYDIRLPSVWDYLPAEELISSSLKNSSPEAKYAVLILAIFEFEGRFARPQQLAAQFARNGHRVYWLSSARRPDAASAKPYEVVTLRDNLYEVRLRSPVYDMYRSGMTPELQSTLTSLLAEFIRDCAISECVTMVQYPFWRKLALSLRNRFGFPILYDCMDDHQDWPLEHTPEPGNRQDELLLFGEADAVVVTAGGLAERARANGADPFLIPNGADTGFFGAEDEQCEISHLPRPIIGFVGGIEQWFDARSLAYVARQRPNYSFVFVGGIGRRADVSELRQLPNVHFLGERKYAMLPTLVRQFDACLIPFLMHPLMKYANQVKLYEYFALGKPTISSRIPELQAPGDLIYFADTKEEYLEQIDKAVTSDPPEMVQARIDFARSTNWIARTSSVDGAIRARAPRVSVIVLTYNSALFLPSFHHYFRLHTGWPNLELIYADNHSDDGSCELIAGFAESSPCVKSLCFDENLGFAGGNNAAARTASGDYLVFLNPDTVVTEGWLGRLIAALNYDPLIGLVTPVTNLSSGLNRIDPQYQDCDSMLSFARQLAVSKHAEVMDIPFAPWFCAALRRSAWESIGELDERFRSGMFEDDDYSRRVAEAGLRIVSAEDCFVHHFGGGSFGRLDREKLDAIFQQNRALFEEKWKSPWRQGPMRPGVTPIESARSFELAAFFVNQEPPL